MNHKNLLITFSLIGIILLLVVGFFITIPIIENFTIGSVNDENALFFNNSTPETTAVSIARLNIGTEGFNGDPIKSVNSDGKYWIVETYNSAYKDQVVVMTIDAKTLMSKVEDKEWKSLDELKATYIADIQSDSSVGKPQKITINGKEIWKIPNYHECIYENGSSTHDTTYIYVDLATGKSKNTWKEFNRAAGKKGWLTLKEVDVTIDKMVIGPPQFKDALRNLYQE